MKNILLTLCICLMSIISYAQVDLNQLIKETQISNSDAENIELLMWMPTEYWEGSFRLVPGFPENEIEFIVDKLDNYIIIACAKADMNMGIVSNYRDYNTSVEQLQLSYNHLTMKPLAKEDIDSEVVIILDMMKPALSEMIGKLGENMHWILFDNKGIVQVDPKADIDLNITFFDNAYKIPLPLNALLPSKLCPTDQAKMQGSWKFCPFHGVELIDKKQ